MDVGIGERIAAEDNMIYLLQSHIRPVQIVLRKDIVHEHLMPVNLEAGAKVGKFMSGDVR